MPEWLDLDTYTTYKHVIRVVTMVHLSYIMINVGFEFDIDKSRLRSCTPPTPLPTSRHPPLRGIPPECTCRAAAQTAAGFIRSAAAASG